MIKAVIFDLDGVICSTDQYHYQAWKQTADYIGVYFDEVVNERLRGVSRMDSLEIILEKSDKSYSLEEKEKIVNISNCSITCLRMIWKLRYPIHYQSFAAEVINWQ